MPTINIDGKLIEASPGQTIIQAAYDNGVEVPHFCWHPDLSIAGNCRMCLCEVGSPRRNQTGDIEKDSNGNPVISFIPKLQIACASYVSDGMVVKTKSEKAIEGQEAVMEFLLINHPLDCPICDEAGECKLQEYGLKHSKGESRFNETKNHKPKRQQWGPNVIFDAERCISCSRCVRFAKEVAQQDVLTFVQRGDHVTIELFEDTQFDSPISMNVIELCPVGALTSPDFRFKSRVWEMSFNESITPADGSGANVKLGVKNNEVLRVQPKTNMYVNKYWLTDDQRLNHLDFINLNRVTEPKIRRNGNFENLTWSDAYNEIALSLAKYKGDDIAVVASARATNEDNFAISKFANEILKTKKQVLFTHFDDTFKSIIEGTEDRRPNTEGAKAIGFNESNDLAQKIKSKNIKALIVFEEDFDNNEELLSACTELDYLVVFSYNNSNLAQFAHVLLPASTFAEIEGTFTNVKGRVQHFTPALVTKENLRFMGMKMSRWDTFGSHNDRWTKHEQRASRQTWKNLSHIANLMGANWTYKKSEDVFADLEANNERFKGMSYELLDEYQGLVLGNASNPDPKIVNYVSHVMKPM